MLAVMPISSDCCLGALDVFVTALMSTLLARKGGPLSCETTAASLTARLSPHKALSF